MSSFERHDVSFSSGDARCAAWLYLPRGDARPPVVVMGHGLGATREMRLDAYAERFAEAGLGALAFTYRHFGDSGGTPRQLLSVGRQLEDWEAALSYARSREELDSERVAVWGTSFGGGHAIVMAARHPELSAAVAQCPFTDGPASALALGPRSSLKATVPLIRDLLAMAARRAPVTIPVAGPPGSVALMNAPDAAAGYAALFPAGMPVENAVAARASLGILAYRPGRYANRVRGPILFCVSETDSVAPPGPTLRYAARAPRGEIRRDPAGHFEFYFGSTFESLVADQADFLVRHLRS